MDLIIGGGVSGLSYAAFCGHQDYLIIEKDSTPGGYCRTVKQDGFTWDYSGHFFHFVNSEIKRFLFEKMNEADILTVQKHAQIYYKNGYVDFPFQRNIHQLEKEDFIDCLYDLFNNPFSGEESFKQMLYAKFGKSIAEKFLIPYNEKLYACDLDLLDTDAMGRYFPYANKEEIIRNFRNPHNEMHNSTFLYPKGGAEEYVTSISSRLDPSKISLNEELLSIDLVKKVAQTNKRTIPFERVISSIALTDLLTRCHIPYDEKVYTWNKVLVFNLGFDKKGGDTVNHWVYFPEKKYCFYRIGYYDNIFNDTRLSLYVELGFDKYAKIDEEFYLRSVLEDLRKAGVITDHKLVSHWSVVMNPAYVHINAASEKDKEEKLKLLESHQVYSIGRYGGWKYISIEENMIEAKELVGKLFL
jgi:protoporphyrinogen oxidase